MRSMLQRELSKSSFMTNVINHITSSSPIQAIHDLSTQKPPVASDP